MDFFFANLPIDLLAADPGSARRGPSHPARGGDVDIHRTRDAEQRKAWIFHPPLDVRNRKMAGRDEILSGQMTIGVDSHLMFRAMDAHHTFQPGVKITGRLEVSADVLGSEDDLRVLLSFEDTVLHPVVAGAEAAVSARSVDLDLALGLAGQRICFNHSVRKLESSVRGMEGAGQAKFDQGLRGIEHQDSARCVYRGGVARERQPQRECKYQRAPAK